LRVENKPSIDAAHAREIVFVKPDYWVVRDRVTGGAKYRKEGRRTIETLWHFTPTELSLDASEAAATSGNERANLRVASATPAAHSLRLVSGVKKRADNVVDDAEDSPWRTYHLQGWGAFGQDSKEVPLPTAIHEANTALPYAGEFLLYPFKGDDPAETEIARHFARDAEGDKLPAKEAIGLRVAIGDARDWLAFGRAGEGNALAFGPLETDARFAQVRADEGQSPRNFGLADGTRLRWNDLALIESDAPLEAFDARRSGDTLELTLANPGEVETLRIHAPDATTVSLNSVRLDVATDGTHVAVNPAQPETVQTDHATRAGREKTLATSFQKGRIHREITNRAGLMLEAPPSVDLADPRAAFELALSNQGQASKDTWKLAVSIPDHPGLETHSPWKPSPAAVELDAPAPGHVARTSVGLDAGRASVRHFTRGSDAGIVARLDPASGERRFTPLVAHAGLSGAGIDSLAEVTFDKANAAQLERFDVEADVRQRDGTFGGPTGNTVSWTFSVDEAGPYLLEARVVTGPNRHSKLSYNANGIVYTFPVIRRENSQKRETRLFLVDLPAGATRFTWKSTHGWSYIDRAALKRVPNNLRDKARQSESVERIASARDYLARIRFDKGTPDLSEFNVKAKVRNRENGFGGPEGNRLEWTLPIPEAGTYQVEATMLAGGDRACRLGYVADGETNWLPPVTAPESGVQQRDYELRLPAGKVVFKWKATQGWSYLRAFDLFRELEQTADR